MTDDGVAAVRTLLAWRRTALAVAVLAAIGVRLGAATLGLTAVVLGGTGIALSLLAYAGAARRYRRLRVALTTGARPPAAGLATLALAGATVVVGAAALAWVVPAPGAP